MKLSPTARDLLTKAAKHPFGRVVGGQSLGRVALMAAGLIEGAGERFSATDGGIHPLYKITDKGREAVKRSMKKTKTEATRTITIGIMAPAAATLIMRKNEDDWDIASVVSVVANDATPRSITEHMDEDTLADMNRLA